MAKVLKEVKITEELKTYIQMLNYEIEGYKGIMETIIKGQGNFSYNKDIYDYHIEKFQEKNIQYRIAMNELVTTYGSELENKSNLYPSIDFVSNVLQFIEVGKGGTCSCQSH